MNKISAVANKVSDFLLSKSARTLAIALASLCITFIIMLYPSGDFGTEQFIENGELSFDNVNSLPVTNVGFYYCLLSKEEKELYDELYAGISKRQRSFSIQECSVDTLKKIYCCVVFDNPELIYIGDVYNYEVSSNGLPNRFIPSYTIGKMIAENRLAAINAEVGTLKELTKGMTDYNKELYIHDYLLRKCSYYTGKDVDASLYGAIITGKTNCRGYSAAYSYLLNCCGIKAGQIIGNVKSNGKTEGHSWNFVILDDEFYYCDTCWDDLKNEESGGAVPFHYSFFNMTYEEINNTHITDLQKEYLFEITETNSERYSYMKQNGLYASDYEEACAIIRAKLMTAIAFNKPLMIQCENSSIYEKFISSLDMQMAQIVKELKLSISHCKYMKIPNGNTVIIYNFN